MTPLPKAMGELEALRRERNAVVEGLTRELAMTRDELVVAEAALLGGAQ